MKIKNYDIFGCYLNSDPQSFFFGEFETIEDKIGITDPFAIIQHSYNGVVEIPMHGLVAGKKNSLLFHNDINDDGRASLIYVLDGLNSNLEGSFFGRALISDVDLDYSGLVMLGLGENKYGAIFEDIRFKANISVPIRGLIKLKNYDFFD